jgi:hypothetical protein
MTEEKEDFAVLCSIDGSPYRFDSGWQDEPLSGDMLTLEEAIKQADSWIKYKAVNYAAIYHQPTGCFINLYDLNGNMDEKLDLAKTLVNNFYEMTKVRAYYLYKNAGMPEGKSLEFWNQAKQKLGNGHPLRNVQKIAKND